jgi:hypothetical protein
LPGQVGHSRLRRAAVSVHSRDAPGKALAAHPVFVPNMRKRAVGIRATGRSGMMRKKLPGVAVLLAVLGGAPLLSGCDQAKAVYPEKDKGSSAPRMSNEKRETIFGPEGLFSTDKKKDKGDGAGIGVNAFLWRASLDTIAFMPITAADAFGGTIITDWYQLPETPNERFKVNVFILDRTLRADGVKVSLFKQLRDSGGNWVDAKVDPKMAAEFENSILTRARQLRVVSTE